MHHTVYFKCFSTYRVFAQISVSELNEFALLYVKDVITNATVLAAKRAVARSSLVDDRTNGKNGHIR